MRPTSRKTTEQLWLFSETPAAGAITKPAPVWICGDPQQLHALLRQAG
jgi:hypothetical protein